MTNYRITKYNPENRNTEGHYQLDEWTCPSEVGDVFNGLKFEEAEYFEIESKYIDAAVKLVESKLLDSLRIVNLKAAYMKEHFSDEDNQWLLDNQFKDIELFEDKSLDISEIKIVIKMILRNSIGCSLEVDGKFRLHFGYDFYMYVSILNIDTDTIEYIKELGLYVEELGQTSTEPNYQFSIDVVGKDQEFVEDTIYLIDITRDKIRKGLGLSVEHPCNHNFQITSENCSIFSDQVKFDFEKNEYFLSCDEDFS